MELSELNISTAKKKQFEAKGIHTVEELLRFLPRKYNDYRTITGIVPPPETSIFLATVNRVIVRNNKKPALITALCSAVKGGYNVQVTWFGQEFIRTRIEACLHETVLIVGKAEYSETYKNYSIVAPEIFTQHIEFAKKIYPVYSKISGMSDDYLHEKISLALKTPVAWQDNVPHTVVESEGLMEMNDALHELHAPQSMESLGRARERLIFNDLLYFAMQREQNSRSVPTGSCYNIKTLKTYMQAIDNLPFHLTDDQQKALYDIQSVFRSGRRLHALLYGDVGSGKSCVAFLSMIAMAENGYQSVLLAPTQVLALQHYNELCRMCEPLGLSPVLVNGLPTKKREREILLQAIRSGGAKLIVGTHALLNDEIHYKNLALVITDEEHRFGVDQRESLIKTSNGGVHSLSMSATPIPRTLAQVMYGDDVLCCELHSMPQGRKPVQSAVTKNRNAVYRFLKRELDYGRQAYVVCPLVDKSERVENVLSVEEVYEIYEKEFAAPNGYKMACLTSRTSKADTAKILSDFQNGSIQILISTTVVEVGVSIPNASAIIIHNAERFGLATLHQLRGRVGRGAHPSYCVLFSTEKDNPRLKAILSTTNGFEIARLDLQIRGAGDFIGTSQSGENKYLSLMLAFPDRYKHICEIASKLVDRGETATSPY